jgi:hypothetical protein
MSQSLRRLAKIEQALEKLLQREKVVVVWHHKVETEKECLKAAIDAGVYDQNTHDMILVISNIETKSRYNEEWTSELPEPNRRTLAQEIEQMAAVPRFEGSYPTEPPPEPKPEKRQRIYYPDSGIV